LNTKALAALRDILEVGVDEHPTTTVTAARMPRPAAPGAPGGEVSRPARSTDPRRLRTAGRRRWHRIASPLCAWVCRPSGP
jgi:hypothetical protein